jgi:hypothetical protein
MPKYYVSFLADAGPIVERIYHAADADQCLDTARHDFAKSMPDDHKARLAEIVVRPADEDRVTRADGTTCIELYWTTPQFRQRQQIEIEAIDGATLNDYIGKVSATGENIWRSPLGREYLRRRDNAAKS